MEKQEKKLICHKCNEELVLQRTDFPYLGHAFFYRPAPMPQMRTGIHIGGIGKGPYFRCGNAAGG